MAKLLNTKLPIAFGEVKPEVYNRMIRTVRLVSISLIQVQHHNLQKQPGMKIYLMRGILFGIPLVKQYSILMVQIGTTYRWKKK